MSTFKSIGSVFLAIAALVAFATLVAVFVYGAVWVSEHLIKYVFAAAWIALAICVLILTPLALFGPTRIVATFGFMICSYVFGTCTWMVALLTTYFYWGFTGIIIGLVLAGVGIFPIGILAALLHADWVGVVVPMLGLGFTYGARSIAFWLASLVDRAEEQRRLKIIESEVAR